MKMWTTIAWAIKTGGANLAVCLSGPLPLRAS